jgi:hypothetical protein
MITETPPRQASKRQPFRSFGGGRLIYLGLLGILLTVIILMGVIRYFGLPSQAAEWIRAELVRQGVEATFGKLYLDPLGRIVAERVEVLKLAESDEHRFGVEKVRFEMNWLSWWRGEPWLAGAVIEEANVAYTLADGIVMKLSEVRIEVELDRHKLMVRNGRVRTGPLEIRFAGVLRGHDWKFPEPAEKLTDEERERRARIWQSIEASMEEIDTRSPLVINLEFEANLDEPEQSRGRLWMESRPFSYREMPVRRLNWSLELADERAEFRGELGLGRGLFELDGLWRWGETRATLEFQSNLDLSLLGLMIPGNIGKILSEIEFRTLPQNDGMVSLDWTEGFTYGLRLKSEWRDFTVEGVDFQLFELPLAFDGKRLLVTDLKVENQTGSLNLSCFLDAQEDWRGKVRSNLDPTSLKLLFGEGLHPFFDSLDFSKGPELEATIEGKGLNPRGVVVKGTVMAKDFSYKGVPFEEMGGGFIFSDAKLYSPKVSIKRPEGTGSAEIWHDFANQLVWVRNGVSTMNTRETAIVFGEQLEEYVRPYRFNKAPLVKVDGLIDLVTGQKTQLTIDVVSPEGLVMEFLGKDIELKDIVAKLKFSGPRLDIIPAKPISTFGGQLIGTMNLNLSTDPPFFQAKFEVRDWHFDQFMRTYFGGEDDLGGVLSGQLNVEGQLEKMESLTGYGDMVVKDGALYRIPIYGALSEVLNALIPGLGYAKANNAKATFKLKDGFILIEGIDIFSLSAVLIGKGKYNFIKDEVDLDMRVNLRGPIGLVFFPVSKLFEYHGTGPLNDTKWEAKIFE